VADAQRGRDDTCPDFNQAMIDELGARSGVKLVVLSARWPAYMNAQPKYYLNPISLRLLDAATDGRSIPMDHALVRTLDAIARAAPGVRVVVIGPVPELPFVLPHCLAEAGHLRRSDRGCRAVPSATPLARAAGAEAAIGAAIRTRPFATAAFPTAALCTSAVCRTMDGEAQLYFDSHHLSASAARRLAPAWLDAALAPPTSEPIS
ncbi:MAG: SGNH hydrolase domain-containing protein, partial [Phenylobacterium sp.]